MTTTEISLSPAAAQRILAIGLAEGRERMLRVAVERRGCSGFQLQYRSRGPGRNRRPAGRSATAPPPWIDEMSMVMLRGLGDSIIVDELASADFKIRNPNAKAQLRLRRSASRFLRPTGVCGRGG